MPHRIVITCRRTGAVVTRDYSRAELAGLYPVQDLIELAAGGTLHVRWQGMEPEHLTIRDTSVPRKIEADNQSAAPFPINEARP